MKKKYGNVSPELITKGEESTLNIENGHSVSYRELCGIIKDRMEELLRLILLEMPDSNYSSLAPAGLVLSGGGSKLAGIQPLAKSVIRIPTRLGQPMGVYGITDVLHDPANATGVGLLLWGVRNHDKPAWEAKRKSGVFGNFVGLLKKFIGA